MRTWKITLLALLLFSGVAVAQQAPRAVSASMIDIAARGNETEVTVSAGTNSGVTAGWKGTFRGIGPKLILVNCGPKSCKGRIAVPMAQMRRATKTVTLRP